MSVENSGETSTLQNRNVLMPKPAVPNSFTIEAFDPGNTTWRRLVAKSTGAFTIFNIQGENRVPYLLHYVGSAAFYTLCDRLGPEDPFQQSYGRLTDILGEFYDPPPLEIAENFRFHQRREADGESVQQFAAALHKLSIHCKFGDYLKTALRNQLVFGLTSKKIQMRLLEKKDLTYEEALKIATTMELSEKSSASLQLAVAQPTAQVDVVQTGLKKPRKAGINKPWGAQKGKLTKEGGNNYNSCNNSTTSKHRVNTNYSNPVKTGKSVLCYRCGRGHLASRCTLRKDIRCAGCDGKGHLKKICFKTSEQADQIEDILHSSMLNFATNSCIFYGSTAKR